MNDCLLVLGGILLVLVATPPLRWWWRFRRHPVTPEAFTTANRPPYSVVYELGADRRVFYWSADLAAVKKMFHVVAPAGATVEFWEGEHCRGRRFA